MRATLIILNRRSDRATLRREQVVKTEILRIGRGADCELHLADPRVLLLHATLHRRPDEFWIESANQAAISVDGSLVETAALRPGSDIRVGPYRLVVEAADGSNISLSVELADLLGDGLLRLRASARTRIHRLLLSRRQWAWLAAITVLVFGLIAPAVAYFVSGSEEPTQNPALMARHGAAPFISKFWLTGSASVSHGRFMGNCTTCHTQPFAKVANVTCQQCHGEVHQHADPVAHPMADLAHQNCGSCHTEHSGTAALIPSGSGTCLTCHARGEHPVTDFATAHPTFRATLPAGEGPDKLVRLALSGPVPPAEGSNLKFPHDKHLRADLATPFGEKVTLECTSCHHRTDSGAIFKTVRFEADCQGCHQLAFDAALPNRRLPHGKPEQIRQFLEETYLTTVMTGEYVPADLPADALRRIPGFSTSSDGPEKQKLREWATGKAAAATDSRLVRGQCNECHRTVDAARNDFDIAPVQLMSRFFPIARFDHNRHRAVACGSCHLAAKSGLAEDVLLPDIASCRNCHGGTGATDKVASGCTTCHDFHRTTAPLVADKH